MISQAISLASAIIGLLAGLVAFATAILTHKATASQTARPNERTKFDIDSLNARFKQFQTSIGGQSYFTSIMLFMLACMCLIIAVLAFRSAPQPSLLLPTGTIVAYSGSTPPPGWIMLSGNTIGNASSNAERANEDTKALYILLWNSMSKERLSIEDSEGVPTKRGTSAVSDFDANKRLHIPDSRGRTLVAPDNLGGTPADRLTSNSEITSKANRLTIPKKHQSMFEREKPVMPVSPISVVLGDVGGNETPILTVDNIPSHSHDVHDPGHNHQMSFHNSASLPGNTNTGPQIDLVYDNVSTLKANTSNIETGISIRPTGDGMPYSNTQPWLALGYMIKL